MLFKNVDVALERKTTVRTQGSEPFRSIPEEDGQTPVAVRHTACSWRKGNFDCAAGEIESIRSRSGGRLRCRLSGCDRTCSADRSRVLCLLVSWRTRTLPGAKKKLAIFALPYAERCSVSSCGNKIYFPHQKSWMKALSVRGSSIKYDRLTWGVEHIGRKLHLIVNKISFYCMLNRLTRGESGSGGQVKATSIQ